MGGGRGKHFKRPGPRGSKKPQGGEPQRGQPQSRQDSFGSQLSRQDSKTHEDTIAGYAEAHPNLRLSIVQETYYKFSKRILCY